MRYVAVLLVFTLHAQPQTTTQFAPGQRRPGNPVTPAIVLHSVSTSSTQAVLSYAAPDSTACRVIISEGTSIAQPVIDLNHALFTDADSDYRAESLVNGAERIFIAGKRRVEKAIDGNLASFRRLKNQIGITIAASPKTI